MAQPGDRQRAMVRQFAEKRRPVHPRGIGRLPDAGPHPRAGETSDAGLSRHWPQNPLAHRGEAVG
ncbi:hypothetical protein IT40_26740 [Paracoccus versutus]|nr:hypothetical protein IT40_26740 [Paracoccus versutus]